MDELLELKIIREIKKQMTMINPKDGIKWRCTDLAIDEMGKNIVQMCKKHFKLYRMK